MNTVVKLLAPPTDYTIPHEDAAKLRTILAMRERAVGEDDSDLPAELVRVYTIYRKAMDRLSAQITDGCLATIICLACREPVKAEVEPGDLVAVSKRGKLLPGWFEKQEGNEAVVDIAGSKQRVKLDMIRIPDMDEFPGIPRRCIPTGDAVTTL